MDPTDLRAAVADKLASGEPIDAQTFNAACFVLSRALEEMGLTVPEAASLVRAALRVAGRVVIDTAPGSDPEVWSNTEATAVEWIGMALRGLGYKMSPLKKDSSG
jgi:hypothetical protein